MKTLRNLVEELQGFLDDNPELADAPVLVATQESCPLTNNILAMHTSDEISEGMREDWLKDNYETDPKLEAEDQRTERAAAFKEATERCALPPATWIAVDQVGSWERYPSGEDISPYAPKGAFER